MLKVADPREKFYLSVFYLQEFFIKDHKCCSLTCTLPTHSFAYADQPLCVFSAVDPTVDFEI